MKDEQKNLKDIDSLTESTPSGRKQINEGNGTLTSNKKDDPDELCNTQFTPQSLNIPIDVPPIPIKVKPKPPHSTNISP